MSPSLSLGVKETCFFERYLGMLVHHVIDNFFFHDDLVDVGSQIDFRLNPLRSAGPGVTPVCRHKRLLQRVDNNIARQMMRFRDFIKGQSKLALCHRPT